MNCNSIDKQLPWLASWFESPKKEILDLNDLENDILNEMSAKWNTSNKIELFNTLGNSFGKSAVFNVIDKVVAAHIFVEWENIAKIQPTQTIDDLVRLLWEPLTSIGFVFTIEKNNAGVQIRCTQCPHVELGKNLNATDWLYHLVCTGDPYLAKGFNLKIGFRRTQTLMEGYLCCNHYYYIKK